MEKILKRVKWGNVTILVFALIGMINVFSWAVIGDGKIKDYNTEVGSYQCKGGAIVKVCWTEDKDVYDLFGR